MNEHRLRYELAVLADEYAIRVDPDGTVDLERIRFPTEWTPETGTLRYVIPEDYPASPPEIHIPSEMRYRGQKDILRKKQSPFDGWNRWCVRFSGWTPRRHTLVTVARAMMFSLSNPSKTRLLV